MRKITKGVEPAKLHQWKLANPCGNYRQLSHDERIEIRAACLSEQFYLCAYCCQRIAGEDRDCMNEHVEAQSVAPNRTLDFSNIVASCTTPKQCDAAHGSQVFKLTPFIAECETELIFKISGRVVGLTARAEEAIRVLNLGDCEANNRLLIEKRRQITDALLMTNGVDSSDGLDDDELIQLVIDDLQQPKNGELLPYSPIAVNILLGWQNGKSSI